MLITHRCSHILLHPLDPNHPHTKLRVAKLQDRLCPDCGKAQALKDEETARLKKEEKAKRHQEYLAKQEEQKERARRGAKRDRREKIATSILQGIVSTMAPGPKTAELPDYFTLPETAASRYFLAWHAVKLADTLIHALDHEAPATIQKEPQYG